MCFVLCVLSLTLLLFCYGLQYFFMGADARNGGKFGHMDGMQGWILYLYGVHFALVLRLRSSAKIMDKEDIPPQQRLIFWIGHLHSHTIFWIGHCCFIRRSWSGYYLFVVPSNICVLFVFESRKIAPHIETAVRWAKRQMA
eukprot:536273_1